MSEKDSPFYPTDEQIMLKVATQSWKTNAVVSGSFPEEFPEDFIDEINNPPENFLKEGLFNASLAHPDCEITNISQEEQDRMNSIARKCFADAEETVKKLSKSECPDIQSIIRNIHEKEDQGDLNIKPRVINLLVNKIRNIWNEINPENIFK